MNVVAQIRCGGPASLLRAPGVNCWWRLVDKFVERGRTGEECESAVPERGPPLLKGLNESVAASVLVYLGNDVGDQF